MVESGNGSVYNPDPYSYLDTTDSFHQLPHHDTQQFYCCEYCGGSHYSSDCQSGSTLVYEQFPDHNYNPSTYHPQPHQFHCCDYCGGPHSSLDCQTRNPFPYNNYDYSFSDPPPQYDMIHTTPQETEQDLLLKALDILKELKEELITTPFRDSREKSMAELLAEEREAKNELSVEELLVLEQAAITRAKFRQAALLDCDDDSDIEDTLDILQFYKGSSDSSLVIPSIGNRGENNETEKLLAVEQMELENSMNVSSSHLPQSVVITPEVHTHSLIMGDEHLDTVPERESDEFIKSSVENLVPIPRESQGTLDDMCDIPSPIECPKDQFETFSDFSDDCTSYGDIEYVEASVPHSDADHLLEEFADELAHIDPLSLESDDGLLDFEADLGEIESLLYHDPSLTSDPESPIENVNLFVPETFDTTLTNPLFEFDSEFTMISNNPIFDEDCDESTMEHEFPDSHLVNDSLHEEFSGELAHQFDCPGGDALNYENLQIPTLPPGMFTSLPFEIQTQATEPALEEEDQIMLFIMIFFLFFTYTVTSSLLHSFGSEDTIFDPGIFKYHYLEPGLYLIGVELSRASNVCPNILNESPIEIISSTSCFPKD